MSLLAIARNDVRESIHSKGVLGLTAMFLIGLAGLAYALAEFAQPDFEGFLSVTNAIFSLLLPLVGIVLGYRTVIAERESGTVALLMSLPNSRTDMVLSKFIGRAAVLAGALAAGAVSSAVVLVARYPSYALDQYLLLLLGGFVYALVFVAIAMALSMAISTLRRVIIAAFGAYVLLVMFWTSVVDVLVTMLFRFDPRALADIPLWAESAIFLSPGTALNYLLSTTLDIGSGATGITVDSQWFASPAVAAVVLITWIVVPLLVGNLRFERAEF